MGFYETLDQILDLLRRRGRVTYRALQREFNLDDAFLADLKDELLYAQHPVVEEEGRGLVWTADAASAAARTTAPAPTPETPATDQERTPLSYTPPHLAARLQQLAEPGTILVSAATQWLVQGYVHLEALPPAQVKGKTELVAAYKVLGLSRRRSPLAQRGERTLSPFMGRARELATLEALLAQVEDGQGQVVGLVGEAGVGKSRLLFEFRQRLSGRRVTYLEGRCLSYGRAIPYVPLLDLLRHNCGLRNCARMYCLIVPLDHKGTQHGRGDSYAFRGADSLRIHGADYGRVLVAYRDQASQVAWSGAGGRRRPCPP